MLPIDSGMSVSQVQDNYLDPRSLNSIKAMGRDRDPQAIKEVAKKFEGLLVQQMLKSMREANDVFSEGNFMDSQTTRFHRDMLDQQMVLNLTSGPGIGLADHFYRQMMQQHGHGFDSPDDKTPASMGEVGELSPRVARSSTPQNASSADALDDWIQDFIRMSDNGQGQLAEEGESYIPPAAPGIPYPLISQMLAKPPVTAVRSAQKTSISASQENFVMMLKPHAEKAARELQINPDVLIAQVALETGWGKHVIHDRSGGNSFNLFNIKAGRSWQGDKVKVDTLEYRNGIAAQEKSDFRKYQSYAESFSDYVRLIKNNPRYEQALMAGNNSSAYADALQSAGYATDPEYAKKIKRLLNNDLFKSLGVNNAVDTVKQGVQAGVQSVISLAATASHRVVE